MQVRLLCNARVYRFDPRQRRWMRHGGVMIEDGRILSLDPHDAGAGVERVDMQGTTILPAFADAHVHIPDMGYFLGERDLSGATSYVAFCDAIARIPNESGIVFAGQYDDSRWLDGRDADAPPLERFHAKARVLISRIDGHSCLVNRAALAWLDLPPQTEGIELDAEGTPTGRLTDAANWIAQARFIEAIPLAQRRAAERAAVELALSRGALHLHAQLYGFKREQYASEIEALRALPARIYPKVCEPDPPLAVELGLRYIGGDVMLDGSLGSRSAALTEPYADAAATRGTLHFSDDELYAFFAEAERLGIAAGVHAIGDAAVDQCVRTWERVLHGQPSPNGTRHFIEHFECARIEHIRACARMGIFLSMQPLFDADWGGSGGMYERRLGTQRMREMNAFAEIVRSGAVLCGGDDAPVCALDPLGGMQAMIEHHEASQRVSAHRALEVYTLNPARLVYEESDTGNLAPGMSADFVVLDTDPLEEEAFDRCRVLQTWRAGAVLYTNSSL